MRIIFFHMTPGLINENQAYKRTVYLLLEDHKVALLSIIFLRV